MADAPVPTQPSSRPASRPADGSAVRHVALLLAACALLFLSGAASLPLLDQEEARCAQLVREMLRSGDWLLPHYLGQPYFDKPAPYFWVAAASEWLTGNAALGGRLVAALAATFAVLTTYAVGRRGFGATAGLIGALVLATSAQFWFMARWYRMDMPFAAAMWAAVAFVWLLERAGAGATAARRRWVWCGFYFFCALATLFKGPAGLALPVMIVGCYLLVTRQARRLAEFFDWRGLAIFVLIALPWYVAVAVRVPSYAYEFLFRQNLMRFGSSEFGHSWPGILYLPILLLAFLPWTLFLPAAVRRQPLRRQGGDGERPHALLLWLAAIVPLLFFSFSSTKLVGYILPCFAPLAVLVGAALADWIARPERLMRGSAYALVVVFVGLCAGAAFLELRLAHRPAWVMPAVALAAVGAGLMLRTLRQGRRGAFVGWSIAGTAALLLLLVSTAGRVAYEQHSTRALAARIPAADRAVAEFLMWPKARTSFVYYTDIDDPRRIRYIDPASIDTVVASLNGAHRVYVLVTGKANLRQLASRSPGRVEVVGNTGDMWLVSNLPARTPAPPG